MAGKSGSGSPRKGGGKPQNGGRGGPPRGQGQSSPARSHRPAPLPPEPEPHPPVYISLPSIGPVGVDLTEAMHADLVEVLGEFQIHPESLSGEASVQRACDALAKELPVVVAGSDLLNPAPSLVEGLLEPLEEFAVVLVPGFGGECLAAALNPMAEWTPESVKAVLGAIERGDVNVGTLTQELLSQAIEVFCQMPWYRASDANGRVCCQAHMKALALSGDEDFLAHRTQVVLDSSV